MQTTATELQRPVERRDFGQMSMAMFGRRISWGAIIAGVVSATFVELVLGSLGTAVGATAVAATDGSVAASKAGIGGGIWFLTSCAISMFIGGWVAGRLSGIPRKAEGTMHGFLTASLGALFVMFTMASAIGGVFGSVSNMAGRGLDLNASKPLAQQVATAMGSGQTGNNATGNTANASPTSAAGAASATNDNATGVNGIANTGVTADQAATGTAAVGYGLFLWLILGGLASMFGGWASAPRAVRINTQEYPR